MKILIVKFSIVFFLLVASTLSHAGHPKERNFYASAGIGYASNDINIAILEEVAYKLNVGYSFGNRWSMELGFHGFGDTGISNSDLINNSIDFTAANFQANAFVLSVLGKASNDHGELFYRVGLAHVASKNSFAAEGFVCADGDTLLGAQGVGTLCESDDSQLAGVLGIGFDFTITQALVFRVEVEHIQGEDEYSAQAATLGLRVNF